MNILLFDFNAKIAQCYQCIANLIKDEKRDLFADTNKIVTRWMNYFCQVLTVQQVGLVRQTEIQTAEPFVSESSIFEAEVAIGKLKRYKSPDGDQIPN
jgi:hypothetical protein